MSKIINTRADLDALRETDPSVWAEFIAKLRGACTQTSDVREYPEGYDRSLAPDAEGYLAPELVTQKVSGPAEAFGYTVEELEKA